MVIPELAITKAPIIRVWERKSPGGAWALPSISHKDAVPCLWSILFRIVDDWIGEAEKIQVPKCQDADSSGYFYLFQALEEIKPRYIQCLFSYINFFFLLENGFSVLFDETCLFAHELGLKIKLGKKPKRSEYLKKLWRVRNHTIVHWGGPVKKHELDSRAGRMWGFSWDSSASCLTEMEFGCMSVVGANDRNLKSIPITHQLCSDYIKEYDSRCAELLNNICSYLPKEIGTRKYEVV